LARDVQLVLLFAKRLVIRDLAAGQVLKDLSPSD